MIREANLSEAVATKERPIIFSSQMVRAIIAGTKTQTRRVVKPQPMNDVRSAGSLNDVRGACDLWTDGIRTFSCPYGQPGDARLWVRESWGLHDTEPGDGPEGARIYYRATDGERHELRYQRWRSPIFMPRWASRLTLRIIDVRVERLQEISNEDALAEGVDISAYHANGARAISKISGILTYMDLWESINAKRGFGWNVNPWLWKITFKRVDSSR